jgi:hypothetical protein
MEAHCEGGQGPPRAVMPRKKKKNHESFYFLKFANGNNKITESTG